MTGGYTSTRQADPAVLTTPEHRDPVMSLAGIWRHWGRGKNRWAVLRGIDLTVEGGTIVGIGGRNGAGI